MEVHDEELCFPQLNTSCRKPAVPWLTAVFLQFLVSFICVLTVTLNLLVIISVSHFRQLHKTTNFLLLSLAISDFLVGLVFFPGAGSRLTSCWFLGEIMCLLYTYIVSLIICASVVNIVLISADRYVAICYPLHYHRRITVARIRLCISLCWIYSACYSTLFVKNGFSRKKASCHGECLLFIDFNSTVLDLILFFITPVTAIIVLYSSCVCSGRFSGSTTVGKSELKAARTLGILVIVFLICFCPFYCAALGGDVSFNTSAAALCLFCISSCLNPLIYTIFYPWFRKAIKHIVTLKIFQPGSSKANIM
ncbi:trace amine-associated receptor 13c-like [Poecilia formosa]|uniref:trace amine-associated receptor 13c-like n=1 Tax=Poecilia formosa TaxID=48698 RepID=UPI0007B9421C|nr:PREDICTED: trace amine-associated receptor 13c-like [Poecilia formosa]